MFVSLSTNTTSSWADISHHCRGLKSTISRTWRIAGSSLGDAFLAVGRCLSPFFRGLKWRTLPSSPSRIMCSRLSLSRGIGYPFFNLPQRLFDIIPYLGAALIPKPLAFADNLGINPQDQAMQEQSRSSFQTQRRPSGFRLDSIGRRFNQQGVVNHRADLDSKPSCHQPGIAEDAGGVRLDQPIAGRELGSAGSDPASPSVTGDRAGPSKAVASLRSHHSQ